MCVCVYVELVPVMDDGCWGGGFTAAPRLLSLQRDRAVWVMALAAPALCVRGGACGRRELISRIELRIINKHNDVSVCQ